VSEEETSVQARLDFAEVENAPVSWSNYFALQYQGGEFILTTAQVLAPILRTPQGTVARRRPVSVPVRPVTRVAVSRAQLEALVDLIRRQLDRFPATGEPKTEAD